MQAALRDDSKYYVRDIPNSVKLYLCMCVFIVFSGLHELLYSCGGRAKWQSETAWSTDTGLTSTWQLFHMFHFFQNSHSRIVICKPVKCSLVPRDDYTARLNILALDK